MRLNASDSWGRRRFSGFHEVGHTFQPGYRQMTLFRCDPSPTRTAASQPEQLADAAAAELLLPRRFFLRDLIEADSGWDGIEQIASHYDASLSATALRAVHLAPRPTLLVVLEPGVRKEERGRLDAESKLRVTTSASSGSFPFVPHNKSATEGGTLDRAFNGEIVEDVTSLNELGINSDRLHVSARLFPYTDHRGGYHKRIMAIFAGPPSLSGLISMNRRLVRAFANVEMNLASPSALSPRRLASRRATSPIWRTASTR